MNKAFFTGRVKVRYRVKAPLLQCSSDHEENLRSDLPLPTFLLKTAQKCLKILCFNLNGREYQKKKSANLLLTRPNHHSLNEDEALQYSLKG